MALNAKLTLITLDGFKCQAYIDYILPCPSTYNDSFNDAARIPLTDTPSHQDDCVPMPIVGCEPCEANTDDAKLVTLCPCRNCRPRKHLIKRDKLTDQVCTYMLTFIVTGS